MIKWGLFINKIDTKAFLIVYSDISWDVLNHKNVMYPAIIVSCIMNENILKKSASKLFSLMTNKKLKQMSILPKNPTKH
jgi:hypothetical protein